jgi:hypothetical protein
MKVFRVSSTIIAILLAAFGVFAEQTYFVTDYYRALQDITIDPTESPDCDVLVSTTCPEIGQRQCLGNFVTIVNGQPQIRTFRVSKRINEGACEIAWRP